MMRLPEFDYVAPRGLVEAAAMLAQDPEHTRVVAGGTDLWPNLKRRHQQARRVVSLRQVAEIRGVQVDGLQGVRVGATTTLAEICRHSGLRHSHPALVKAVRSIASPPIRNMATLGGNLCLDTRCTYYNQTEEWRRAVDYCLKEAGNTCWVAPSSSRCWAVSSSDAAPVLCALGASVRLVCASGERTLPLADFYREDGIDYLAKTREEIVAEVLLPPPGAWRATYWKLRRRGSIDFPVLGVAVALRLDSRAEVREARIFLGAVASRPVEAHAAAACLMGGRLELSAITEAARRARDPATPLDNTDYSLQWRRKMVAAGVEGALRELAGLPPGLLIPWGASLPV